MIRLKSLHLEVDPGPENAEDKGKDRWQIQISERLSERYVIDRSCDDDSSIVLATNDQNL